MVLRLSLMLAVILLLLSSDSKSCQHFAALDIQLVANHGLLNPDSARKQHVNHAPLHYSEAYWIRPTPLSSSEKRPSPDLPALLPVLSRLACRSSCTLSLAYSRNTPRSPRLCSLCIPPSRWLRAMPEQGLPQIANTILQHRYSSRSPMLSEPWLHLLQCARAAPGQEGILPHSLRN